MGEVLCILFPYVFETWWVCVYTHSTSRSGRATFYLLGGCMWSVAFNLDSRLACPTGQLCGVGPVTYSSWTSVFPLPTLKMGIAASHHIAIRSHG